VYGGRKTHHSRNPKPKQTRPRYGIEVVIHTMRKHKTRRLDDAESGIIADSEAEDAGGEGCENMDGDKCEKPEESMANYQRRSQRIKKRMEREEEENFVADSEEEMCQYQRKRRQAYDKEEEEEETRKSKLPRYEEEEEDEEEEKEVQNYIVRNENNGE
jgi:hypothetical protein